MLWQTLETCPFAGSCHSVKALLRQFLKRSLQQSHFRIPLAFWTRRSGPSQLSLKTFHSKNKANFDSLRHAKTFQDEKVLERYNAERWIVFRAMSCGISGETMSLCDCVLRRSVRDEELSTSTACSPTTAL